MNSSRILRLATFAMIVLVSVEMAFANSAYSFRDINVPEAEGTGAFGINFSGQIVGSFVNPSAHGFVDTNGTFTTVDVPGDLSSNWIEATGINNSDQLVGWFRSTATHGFVDTGGSFTTINVPGAKFTVVTGINNRGQIVGYFGDATGQHGFVDTGASFTTIDVPYGQQITAYGINDSGQIVGGFVAGGIFHGFVDTFLQPTKWRNS